MCENTALSCGVFCAASFINTFWSEMGDSNSRHLGLCYLLMIIYLVVQIRRKEMTIGKAVAFVGALIVIEMLRR